MSRRSSWVQSSRAATTSPRSCARTPPDIGVADRVRLLGYLPEAELEQVLVATDVALCPFRFMSASGALATWISAGRPIVASDLAPIRELDDLAPGALRRFAPYEPAALAAAIGAALAEATSEPDPRVEALAGQLATPRIVERYAADLSGGGAARRRPVAEPRRGADSSRGRLQEVRATLRRAVDRRRP